MKVNNKNGLTVKYNRIYNIWHGMIGRCYDPRFDNYKRYGAKGITVCKEWLNGFEDFLEWSLNNGYAENLQIDRIESIKPYSPDNCRWATLFVQAQNKGMSKSNRSGYKGVCYDGNNKYRVYITRDGKKLYVGYFTNLPDAISARKAKENQYAMTGTI